MLSVEGLEKNYRGKAVLAGIDLTVGAGKIIGLVGTSGAGKSTVARCISGLERPSGGVIRWDGGRLGGSRSRRQRREIQTVFQDPRASLNPRWTVRRSLREPLDTWFTDRPRSDRDAAAASLLEQVGLGGDYLERFPHELSTGQCQRICIARALAPEPRLLLLDEPLSALDLPAQAQMLDLLRELKSVRDLSYLFISHDIVVVSLLCDEVAVLEHGRIVEHVAAGTLLTASAHPHTRALIADTPILPRRGADS
ncbi:ABC transporter ATP-binding protein [Rhodococcus spelaei]|uniref:ABC transporter ATP-binding protein n=1 Tax=Rhodococcus spelaei TaxID=2546320 RepID=A0A541BM88_9NOCA|nr:ABC transporter ATP-binding protein [Rhodococcus spelaei]TQF73443.1 ABC transporter ATP-binding protein [Rhodococcus spelaei]